MSAPCVPIDRRCPREPSSYSRRVLSVVLSGLVTLSPLLTGCGRQGTDAPVGGDPRTPRMVDLKRNVELARVEQRPLVYYVETVGVLQAEGETEIAAGVSGVVDEVLFREGDLVDQNTILVKVDQRRYRAALRVAEANEQRAQANLALARDLALRAQRAGAGASVEEKAKTALALSVAEAELLSAQAALELARNNFEKSQVRAPYAGQIDQRRVTPGTYLEDKTVIATMADLSRLRLVGWVPETAAPLVRELKAAQEKRIHGNAVGLVLGVIGLGTPWAALAGPVLVQANDVPSGFDPEFTVPALPDQTFRARIFFLSKVADPSTHMFECKAEIDRRFVEAALQPGYTARIRFPLRSNDRACVVPEEAVRATERGFVAFEPVLRPGRDGGSDWVARAVPLDLGYRAPGWVEVRRGLTPGQWIVRRGAEALEDGTPIRFPEDPTLR
ncbi:MAG: efflux RND transporter periplasmic adaptor subunit [Gemmataceae bacterium]|nr:efflux RND transporter periplasmic adaptor subunit [Gemmataceae bacterium]MDW8265769.1 efflux RND transporter periplasmic adaptor subunit [Gemmataceae bacterium]